MKSIASSMQVIGGEIVAVEVAPPLPVDLDIDKPLTHGRSRASRDECSFIGEKRAAIMRLEDRRGHLRREGASTLSRRACAIDETCRYLNEMKYNGIVVLKSTVEPQTTKGRLINIILNYSLFHFYVLTLLMRISPTEAYHHAGSTNLMLMMSICRSSFRNLQQHRISICSSTESECTKIFCNTFYSGTQFFNELYLLCNKLGVEFNAVKEFDVEK